MTLSLNDDQRAQLLAMGVAEQDGALRSLSGRTVSDGAAALMLVKGAMEAGGFRGGYLHEGHQAQHAQGIGGVPTVARDAVDMPVAAPEMSEADDLGGPDDDEGPVPGRALDSAGGHAAGTHAAAPGRKRLAPPGVAAKAVNPAQFGRGYLAPGHALESPADTGVRGTTPMPQSHPAEPQQFGRGWLAEGHQAPSPASRPPNNPHPPGTQGPVVYEGAAGEYAANRAANSADHTAMTGAVSSHPAPAQWSPPSDLGATHVPVPVQAMTTHPAPGER